jgi:Carboxypeptidase regulatory-like domain/TonB dependent receptor-like, beta-barrel
MCTSLKLSPTAIVPRSNSLFNLKRYAPLPHCVSTLCILPHLSVDSTQIRWVLRLVLWLCLLRCDMFGQSQAVNGVIEGTIVDASGASLPDVRVVIKHQDTGLERQLETDKAGRFRATLLPVGNYEVAARHPGFAPTRRAGVVLELAQTLNVDLRLSVEGVGLKENLLTKTSSLETERKQPSTRLNERFINSLPVSGRKFLDLGVMVPGATEFGERDTLATADFAGVNHFFSDILVDGTDAYQAWTHLPRGTNLVPFEFSQDAIREFQVLSSSFTAEFGRSAGGLMNVITKSGTNLWHGDAFYFITGSSLNATPRFAPQEPDSSQQQFGGVLGGPIKKDRLFFFGSYDQQIRSDPVAVTSGTVLNEFDSVLASVTSSEERQRLLEARDFISSQIGNLDRDFDQFSLLGKTDWQINQRHNVSARFNHQEFEAINVPANVFEIPAATTTASPSNNGRVTVKNNSFALQVGSIFSSHVVNEARFQFAFGDERTSPNAPGPQVRIGSESGGFVFGGSENQPVSLDEHRLQWLDNVTVLRGRHEIKTGFDINRVSDGSFFLRALNGSYRFNDLRDFANGRYLTYLQGFGIPSVDVVNGYYNFFVQDNFRVTPRFSLNLGFRYELQHLQQPTVTNPEFPQTQQPTSDDRNNFAPRFGFAWAPDGQKTVVRGNYGVYYAPLPIQVNGAALTNNGVYQASRLYRGPADPMGATPGAPNYPEVRPADLSLQSPSPGARIAAFSPDLAHPYVQHFNVEIERELATGLTLSSGWLFTKGTRLRRNDDLNLFPPVSEAVEVRDSRMNFFGSVTIPSFGGPASRPFPFFDQITEFKFDHASSYHSFFVQANKRYSRGFQFLANYTLSKLIESGFTPGNAVDCCASENPFDPRDERGLGRRDQTHRFNFAAVWDTPRLATDNFLAKYLLNAWQLSPIVKVGNGRPYTATVTGDLGGDVNRNRDPLDRAPLFGRNTFRGPGYAAVDLRVQRTARFDNGKSIGFIVEFFNLFNRGNFLRPYTDYYRLMEIAGGPNRLEGPLPTFGQEYNALRSREIQFAVRFSF